MADKIADAMAAISEDPARLKAYRRNKDAELARFDLTQEQRNIIKKEDAAEIRAAIKQESGPGAVVVLWET